MPEKFEKFFVPKLKESPEKPEEETEEKVGYVPLEPGQRKIEIEGMPEGETKKIIEKAGPDEKEKKEKEE